VTEGGTAPDGAFHRVSRFHDEVIQEIFTHEVFSLLLQEKLIGLSMVQKILNWRHTGFSVHSKVRTESKSEAERVGKYMIRPLLSLKRLFFLYSRTESILDLFIWRLWVNCAAFGVVELVGLDVTPLFKDVSAWKMGKIVRDLKLGQKGNSYISFGAFQAHFPFLLFR